MTNFSRKEATMREIFSTQNYRKTPKGVLTNIYSHQQWRSKIKDMPPPKYSLKEFQDEFLNDTLFIRLFNEWVKSDYKKNKKPSFDRIDCFKPYSFDNIHLVTWEENRYKQRMEVTRIRATKIKSINVITGEETIYKSVSDAVAKTWFTQGCISSALNGHLKTYKGFKWEYIGNPKRKIKTHTKKCQCCGREFVYGNKNQKFCSRKCGSMNNKNACKKRAVPCNIHDNHELTKGE